MPGDWISDGPDHNTQKPEMVSKAFEMAAEISCVKKWYCIRIYSMPDPDGD